MLKQTSPNELIALTLLDAQALVEREWCQGELQVGGALCVVGAINQAVTGRPTGCTAECVRAYDALVTAVGGTCPQDAVDWNNAPGRTQAEVAQMLGKAAELVRVSA